MNNHYKSLIYLMGLVTTPLAYTSSINVYSLTEGTHWQASAQPNTTYLLQLGAFKNRENAINHQHHLQTLTDEPIHLTDVPNKDFYQLSMGPFLTVEQLHHVSEELLQSKHAPHASSTITSNPRPTAAPVSNITYSTPTAAPVSNHTNTTLFTGWNVSSYQELQDLKNVHRLITVSVGPAWNSSGQTQTIALQPDVSKTYAALDKSQPFVNGELFLGWQRGLPSHSLGSLWGQLGVFFAGSTNAPLSGDIWEDANPNFNNFSYDYTINHAAVGLQGKILSDLGYSLFLPYINAGIGASFNRAHAFFMTPKISEEVAFSDFTTHTESTLTYNVGAGFQSSLTRHWQAGLGYSFSDWGASQLAAASGQTQGKGGIHLSHLYVNSLFLQFTYLG